MRKLKPIDSERLDLYLLRGALTPEALRALDSVLASMPVNRISRSPHS